MGCVQTVVFAYLKLILSWSIQVLSQFL